MNTSGSTNKVAVAACPFCGGTDTACGIADEEFGRFWVECICGARGPTVETLKDARPAWNKRLAPEPSTHIPDAGKMVSTNTVSDARLQDLINLYDGQAFRGDTVLALEELQRLRHYVATCGGTDNDGRCPMHHLAGLAPEPQERLPPREALARDRRLYGSSWERVDADGSRHRVDPRAVQITTGEPGPLPPAAVALDALKAVMMKDPAFAWTWHCGLAMSIMDNLGANHGNANRAAAAFMRLAFEVDTSRQSETKAAEPRPVAWIGLPEGAPHNYDAIYDNTRRLDGYRYLPIWRPEDHPSNRQSETKAESPPSRTEKQV